MWIVRPGMNLLQLPLGVRLRDDATFANYYPGANPVALGYVERLCQSGVGCGESLIYLWGGAGCGRSHLLQAACLRLAQEERQAVYLPLADVVMHGPKLLEELDRCELVCLDDLQAVVGLAEWEEALFHLFNRLRDAGGRLLLSADAAPRKLGVLLADLQSRLSQALVFKMYELAEEDKLRALQLRASRRGLALTDEVGRFILNRGARSMSDLFELLDRLDQASLQAQRRLTIPFLKQVLDW